MTLSSVGGSAALQQLQAAMFKSADVNNDGQLSSDEVAALGQNLQGAGDNAQVSITLSFSSPAQNFSSDTLSSLLDAQQSRHAEHAEKMFASADKDGDGKVTADELTADLEAHASKDAAASGAPSAADMAARMIKSGDTDGDGSLSLDEMKAMKPPGGHHHGGPPPADGAQGASAAEASSSSSTSYDPADTNKDGAVSSAELIASLQSAAADGSSLSGASSFDLLSQLLAKLTASTTSTVTSAVTA